MPTARELALEHDELAALAADRVGPDEARAVVFGVVSNIGEQLGEAIHARRA
jgi:hypothetical protein